jgi:ubiquinone/menaquinone biosynthesis C-methylase UbiE
MANVGRSFIPAAGYDWLLPLYDPLQRWILREDTLKRPLVAQAAIRPGQWVLDIGCGTGSVTLLVKRLHPDAHVVGLDPDPKALARAARKAERRAIDVHFERGFSDRLPFRAASFDAVFSSLMFHHLTREEKLATLHEVRRVLRPGGSFNLFDFGPPRSWAARVLAHAFHRTGHMQDNIEGRIPTLMSDSGLLRAQELSWRGLLANTFSYYRAFSPASSPH